MGNPIASGLMCLGPSFFVSAAFILSIFANSRCNFYRLSDTNPIRTIWFSSTTEPDQIGLWCYQNSAGYNYDTRSLTGDDMYESARNIGTATMAIGFCVWLFYLFAGCKPFPPVAFKIVGLLGVVNCMMQSLVFLLNKSDACYGLNNDGCELSTGANCAIAAAVMWFVGGVMSCAAGKEVEGGDGGEEVGDEGGED